MTTERKKRDPHSIEAADIMKNAMGKYGKEKGKQIATFAITLNKEMEKQGIDQDKMASDLIISTGALSNYRNGKTEPGLTALVKIADYLKLDCNYLMTGITAKNVTVNADLGLSETAINSVREYPEEGKEALSKLLSHEDSDFFMAEIYNLYTRVTRLQHYVELMKDYNKDWDGTVSRRQAEEMALIDEENANNITKNILKISIRKQDPYSLDALNIEEAYNQTRLCLFELSETLSDILEDLFPHKDLLEEWREEFYDYSSHGEKE